MSTSKHPKGLYLIFATSTAERFSYYGMRAIFILFLTQALLFDKEHAASIYGSYTGLVYLTPLIGGYIADKYWGIRRSVFWGAIMMAVGQFLMFFSASMLDAVQLSHWLMYGGLTFLILGNGCFRWFAATLARPATRTISNGDSLSPQSSPFLRSYSLKHRRTNTSSAPTASNSASSPTQRRNSPGPPQTPNIRWWTAARKGVIIFY